MKDPTLRQLLIHILSILETTLEWAQNTCEPPRIILYQNCHLSQWLPLSSHSRLLTPGLAVPYSSLCGSLHGYLLSCRRLLQALRPTRFPKLLFAIMHCCLFLRMRLLISPSLYSLPP